MGKLVGPYTIFVALWKIPFKVVQVLVLIGLAGFFNALLTVQCQ